MTDETVVPARSSFSTKAQTAGGGAPQIAHAAPSRLSSSAQARTAGGAIQIANAGAPATDPARARRSLASAPVSSNRRANELLFEWETRNFSPLRRWATARWREYRRAATVTLTVALLGLVAAAVVEPPDLDAARLALLERVRLTESTLHAREGELKLAHLELNRLTAIHEYSRKHRIPADLAAAIHDIALAEGIEPALAFSLVRVESGFARRAVSSAGAVGLTQVMPATAFWLQPGIKYNDLFERDTNLRLGFRYLRMLLRQYKGDLNLALLAYNRGPGTVDEILASGGNPANGYDRVVRAGATNRPSND